MAPPLAHVDVKEQSARVLSALVLAPPVLMALYLGPPYSDALVLLAAALMAWECARVATGKSTEPMVFALAAVAGLAVLAAAFDAYFFAFGLLALAGVAAFAVARARSGAILGAGLVYLGAACIAFLWLRQVPGAGLALIVWLVATVWANDIAAYLAGRRLGGPRLAPRVSPRKTWSGLCGGILAASAVGALCAAMLPALSAVAGGRGIAFFTFAGAFLALVSQGGDLLESAYKRYFHVKDASSLIPGHGGLLDRADGLLAASLALALTLRLIRGGT